MCACVVLGALLHPYLPTPAFTLSLRPRSSNAPRYQCLTVLYLIHDLNIKHLLYNTFVFYFNSFPVKVQVIQSEVMCDPEIIHLYDMYSYKSGVAIISVLRYGATHDLTTNKFAMSSIYNNLLCSILRSAKYVWSIYLAVIIFTLYRSL